MGKPGQPCLLQSQKKVPKTSLWAQPFIRGGLFRLKPRGRVSEGFRAGDSEGTACAWATSACLVALGTELGTQ